MLDENAKDDFNEDISHDSDDEKNNRAERKGFLTDEMVQRMNFGGGEDAAGPEGNGELVTKKSRKEVFEEIMEKSKSYDAARKELKTINLNM